MSDPLDRDARWQALHDALAVEDEAEAPDFDVRAEPQWREELEFYEALGQAAMEESLPQANDAAIIEAALRAVPTEPASRSRLAVVVAAFVAVAALAVLWFAVPTGVELRGAQGSWATEAGDTVALGDPVPANTWLRVAAEACMARGDAKLCALGGARVRVTDPDARALELAEGAVRVEAGTWRVDLAGEVHTLTAGDTLVARTLLAKAEPVPGPVIEHEPEREPEPEAVVEPEPEPVVEATREPSASKRSSRPRADAATLLARARKALGERRVDDAARDYEELLRRFPSSSEAKIGRISLAGLELDRGRAKVALRLYTTAAKGGGIAAEEAAWGRLRALHRLHRQDALRQAVEDFTAKYPTSAYRARAQGLLE